MRNLTLIPHSSLQIYFLKIKLIPSKKTKTGFSTDVNVLEDLKSQHEIAQILLDYRMLTKLKSTYIEGLLAAINPETNAYILPLTRY